MVKGATVLVLTLFLILGCLGSSLTAETWCNGEHLYYVYTRDKPREPVQLCPNAQSVLESAINFRPKTAIIVHGHEGSGFTSLNPVVKDAFLTSEDVNVIVVDWSAIASQRYSNAVSAVPNVGAVLADFINTLVAQNRIDLSRLHLIGFDLGAHVVGFTGRTLNGSVARITGLDPAASQWGSNSERLRQSDARYVEVIHTDGDGLASNGIGTAIGHVDFFPNGGSKQPGCVLHSCSHDRAWQFFAATLTHDHLVGNLCTSNLQITMNLCRGFTLPMGNNELVKFGSGSFRVNTRRSYPF